MSGIGDSLVGIIETFMHFYSKGMRKNMEDYCDLETADDERTLVMQDGTLVSIFKLDGAKRLVGEEEYDDIVNKITSSMFSYMANGGHAMQVYFERDPDSIRREIDLRMRGSVETAKRLNLDVLDIINDRKEILSRYCSHEVCYIALATTPAALSKDALKRSAANQKESYSKLKAPAIDAQNPIAAIGDLRDRHSSFVNAVENDMRSANLNLRLMEVHESVRAIRMSIDPEYTDDTWKPHLPGDPLPKRISRRDKAGADLSDLLWPRLSLQIFPRDLKVEDDYMTIGDRTYASMHIDIPANNPQPFAVMFKRASDNNSNIPWRVSFLIESGGIKAMSIKNMMASILAFSNSDNRLICDALDELKAGVERGKKVDTKLRVSFSTWGPSDNLKLVKQRSQQLARAVEGWGNCNVQEISGDPVASFISNSLNVTRGSVATPAAVNLKEAIQLLPFRPSSPWESGTILFRSPDGKLMPYTPGSSLQDTWIDLIFAGPGSGKSVMLNAINFALCMSPNIKRLPRIFIIDIGPSSKGLISLLKEALPPDQKHLAMYTRLSMDPKYAINPFDTQLGCRKPMPLERAFLVNFLTLLVTPIGTDKPFDGVAAMAGQVVDIMYEMYSDDATPKPYSPNIDEEVDKAIAKAGMNLDKRTTWWEVVDYLYAKGMVHDAYMAQRYAVPNIPDAVAAVNQESVRKMYDMNTPSGEPLVNSFGRMIQSAVREYPILSGPTKFDLGEARVVSLDLDQVAKSGGDAADRQTGVMYMLARYLARDFYMNKDDLDFINPKYRPYHKVRIEELSEDVKRICMDEFHRTKKSSAVRDQVIIDMREGRKWQVHVALLSQSIEDFDPMMTEFATNVFFLSAGNVHAVDKAVNMFGFNSTDRFALLNRVHGPRAGGPTFLAYFKTKQGNNIQLMTNTAGAIEMWAFSTTMEDVLIREKLYGHLGQKKARKVLAAKFPSGSAKAEIDRRAAILKEEGLLSEASELGVIDKIVLECLEKAADFA